MVKRVRNRGGGRPNRRLKVGHKALELALEALGELTGAAIKAAEHEAAISDCLFH